MANVSLALTGVAGTGAVGSLRYLSGSVALALLPQIAIRGSTGVAATAAVTLPTPVISIRGLTSVVGKVRLTLPSPTLAAAGFSGASGAVALTLPAPEVAVLGPAAARLGLPVPQVAVKGTTGAVGSISLLMRAPTLQLAASIPHVGAVALTLPAPAVRSQALTGLVGASHNTLREFALAIRGYSGTVGKVALTLPVVQLDAAGAMLVTGKVALTLPALQLQATGESAATGAVSTVVMHTETNAVWTYSNFPFNSFAQFNGVYLGASANGLFALTGDTDNGEMIQAAARVGITDFATSHLKRVDRLYVGYRTDGNLVLRVFTDEVTERDYLLPTNQAAGLHGARVRVGKGLEARYWQFEIDNQNGAYFDLNMIELQPTVLKRRVGGFDA